METNVQETSTNIPQTSHKKLWVILLSILLLFGVCIAVYHIPDVKRYVDYKINKLSIERQLEKRYSKNFKVTEISEGIQLTSFLAHEMDAAYTFIAFSEEAKLICGYTDKNYKTLIDSYPIYLYEAQLQDKLTKMLEPHLDNYYVMPLLLPSMSFTRNKDAGNFEDFFQNTESILNPIYLYVSESAPTDELKSIVSFLEKENFPFNVNILRLPEAELKLLQENQPLILVDGQDGLNQLMSDVHGDWGWCNSALNNRDILYTSYDNSN